MSMKCFECECVNAHIHTCTQSYTLRFSCIRVMPDVSTHDVPSLVKFLRRIYVIVVLGSTNSLRNTPFLSTEIQLPSAFWQTIMFKLFEIVW